MTTIGADVWHKIIHKKFGWYLSIFVDIVKNQTPNLWKTIYRPNHWVTIQNTQQKVCFAYLFPNCLNLQLPNLILKIKKKNIWERTAEIQYYFKILLPYLLYSQIWLSLPVDDCQFGYITKLQKNTTLAGVDDD